MPVFSRRARKIVCIFLLLITFTTACANKNLYELKTDLSDEEGVERLISQMDWDGDKVKKVEIDGENIEITMTKDYADYDLTNAKSFLVNAINLIVLTGAQNVDYLYNDTNGNDTSFFSIDYEVVDIIIDTRFKESVEHFSNNEEEFKKLQDYLKDYKVEGIKD